MSNDDEILENSEPMDNMSTSGSLNSSPDSPVCSGFEAPVPRQKVYPDGSAGPWVVFFRTKNKPLKVLQISQDLGKRFRTVTEIHKVRPDKLRVVCGSLKEANEIACCELFTSEYRVYVPSRNVEIDGVVTEASLRHDDFTNFGVGHFKDPRLRDVKILECRTLYKPWPVEGKTLYRPSGSFRVTFAGSVLPDYVIVDRVRLPVRLFIPRVMNCVNCKQLGHTATHCCNKVRCGKCGGSHGDDACSVNGEKCIYCEGTPHDLTACPTYKEREQKLKRSLRDRHKRSFAEMLKRTIPPVTETPYALLPVDEQESDEPIASTSSGPLVSSRKRKKPSPTLPSRVAPRMLQTPQPKTKKNPPGFANFNSSEFPPLPGTSQTPNVQIHQNETQSDAGLLKFSFIVDTIFKTFDITDPLKSCLTAVIPIVRTFLKQFFAQWPTLSAFVSFDE